MGKGEDVQEECKEFALEFHEYIPHENGVYEKQLLRSGVPNV